MQLPKQYAWLNAEPGPRILKTGLSLYGVVETPGSRSTPAIMAWARRVGIEKIYLNDDTAWCGLYMAYVALEAGWEPPVNPLGARNWLSFGRPVSEGPGPAAPALGDVLVFWRGSRSGWMGHVGLYVGEDHEAYHVLGGNQDNRVSIKRIPKNRLLGARRCPWRTAQPANVRVVRLAATGALSMNEA